MKIALNFFVTFLFQDKKVSVIEKMAILTQYLQYFTHSKSSPHFHELQNHLYSHTTFSRNIL